MVYIPKKNRDYGTGIPDYVAESLARCMLPDIIKFYESDEGQAYYQKWKEAQDKRNDNSKA